MSAWGLALFSLPTRADGAVRVRGGRGGNTMSADILVATIGRGSKTGQGLRGQPCSFLLSVSFLVVVGLFFGGFAAPGGRQQAPQLGHRGCKVCMYRHMTKRTQRNHKDKYTCQHTHILELFRACLKPELATADSQDGKFPIFANCGVGKLSPCGSARRTHAKISRRNLVGALIGQPPRSE